LAFLILPIFTISPPKESHRRRRRHFCRRNHIYFLPHPSSSLPHTITIFLSSSNLHSNNNLSHLTTRSGQTFCNPTPTTIFTPQIAYKYNFTPTFAVKLVEIYPKFAWDFLGLSKWVEKDKFKGLEGDDCCERLKMGTCKLPSPSSPAYLQTPSLAAASHSDGKRTRVGSLPLTPLLITEHRHETNTTFSLHW